MAELEQQLSQNEWQATKPSSRANESVSFKMEWREETRVPCKLSIDVVITDAIVDGNMHGVC